MNTKNELSAETQNGNLDKPMLTRVFLAPYLPYGLQTKYRLSDVISVLVEKDEIRDKELTGNSFEFVLKYCKPILRPLSDLTRTELEKAGFRYYIDYLTYENKGVEWTLKAPYDMVVYLLSQHYDIYGLIEKGLAISIHDVV